MAVPAPRDPRSCLVGPVSGAVKNIVRIACCCPHCPGLASTWKEQMTQVWGGKWPGLGWGQSGRPSVPAASGGLFIYLKIYSHLEGKSYRRDR